MSDRNPSDLPSEPSSRNNTISGENSTEHAQNDDLFGAGQGLGNLNRPVNEKEIHDNMRKKSARPPVEFQQAAVADIKIPNSPHMLQGQARRLKMVQDLARVSEGTGNNARAEAEYRAREAEKKRAMGIEGSGGSENKEGGVRGEVK
jgi:hypothetical protein